MTGPEGRAARAPLAFAGPAHDMLARNDLFEKETAHDGVHKNLVHHRLFDRLRP